MTRCCGVNTNALCPPTCVDEPSGNGARNGIPVTVVHVGQVTPAGYVPRRNAGKTLVELAAAGVR